MSDDKAKLLHSLAIDRRDSGSSSAAATPLRRLMALAVGGFSAIILGAWFFIPRPLAPDNGGARVLVQHQAPQEPAPSQPTAAEPRRTAASALSASGYVVARRKATVAAEITGKVVELFVDEGMVVKPGQILARLDSVLAETDMTLSQSKAAAAEAAVAATSAELRDAERIFARIQGLSQKNFASEADLTKAEARAGVLRAQLTQTQSQLQAARLEVQRYSEVLEKHRIRAPFGGVVIERSAQPGEMISPMSSGGFTRTGICTIVDPDSIEIEVDVNEAFIGRVRTGGAVSATLDAYPDWTIPASVIAIVPTANREKATVKVRIALKQKDPRILPDMAVKVKFLDDIEAASAN